jgi:type IV pilus assembly protein PilB
VLKDVSIGREPARAGAVSFGSILIGNCWISQHDLSVAEHHAEREQMDLVDAVVALGLLDESRSYAALAGSLGLDAVELELMETSELAIRLVPERLARRHMVVPIGVDNRVLTYATCRPLNAEADRDVAFASGRRTRMVVASRSGVQAGLDRCYPKLRELDVLAERLRSERPDVQVETGTASPGTNSTVIELCDHLIGRAVDMGASDVHVECGNEGTLVRYRICGVLEPVLTLPASVSQPVRNRFKIMARADIAVRHRPQDGSFRLKVNGRPVDVRLSTLPTVDGEKIVMRVIDSHSPLQTIEKLGYDEETLGRFQRALERPDGLVLFTGPTGSGKTTALYAALNHLRTGRTNIVSVEDPVERAVAGVTQIPVNARAGNTFQTVLRSLLRQDPNVIMVGEIRDAEVAQIVGQAAYTGHLVLSSMHTADTATAITRLTNLGLEPYKVAESLAAVVAQRLVRSLCPHCRRANNDIEAKRKGTEHHIAAVPYAAGPGCEHCKFTGYAGRLPVTELLTPSDDLRDAIVRGATAHEIRNAMRAAGVPSMREQALRLVVAGKTSIEEVNRVLSAEGQGGSRSHAKQRVLVTDDEPITRMLVKLLLEKQQYEVLEATNGREAVEIATRERPDLLLCDLNMPELDGYETISRLRRDMSLAMMPILVLTGEEGPAVERRVLQLGADDYIVKPFDPEVLLSRVNAVFRRLKVIAA